jgi:hypothetical protein
MSATQTLATESLVKASSFPEPTLMRLRIAGDRAPRKDVSQRMKKKRIPPDWNLDGVAVTAVIETMEDWEIRTAREPPTSETELRHSYRWLMDRRIVGYRVVSVPPDYLGPLVRGNTYSIPELGKACEMHSRR